MHAIISFSMKKEKKNEKEKYTNHALVGLTIKSHISQAKHRDEF